MGAIVLSDPGGEPQAADRRRYVLPAILGAGWVALFAYSAAYLTEDLPFRPQPPDAERPPATQPDPSPRRVIVLDVAPAPGQAASGQEPTGQATPGQVARALAAGAPKPTVEAAPAGLPAAPVVPPRPAPVATAAAPDYVGVWGPTVSACGARSRRRGYLPATITPDRAAAGRTLCSFHDGRRAGNAWLMAAECSDRGRRWASQVRLVVEGDRLTWSSSRGTSTYVRCGRHAG